MQRLGDVLRDLKLPRVSNGSTHTTPDEVCPKCRGAGWMRWDVDFGHPNFGREVMCECLSHRVDERDRQNAFKNSNLEALQHLTFESFDPAVPGVRRAYDAARAFSSEPRGWLVLYGPFGAGKTHLAASVAHSLVERRSVIFQVVPDLLGSIRSAFDPQSDVSAHRLLEMVKNVNVLILDDLGEENETPWVREQLYVIFNHRYTYRMPTVVTTNKSPDKIDDRIWSRMFDRQLSVTVKVDAGDYRGREARRPTRNASSERGSTRRR
jgi:DNA replication protein DnaC